MERWGELECHNFCDRKHPSDQEVIPNLYYAICIYEGYVQLIYSLAPRPTMGSGHSLSCGHEIKELNKVKNF